MRPDFAESLSTFQEIAATEEHARRAFDLQAIHEELARVEAKFARAEDVPPEVEHDVYALQKKKQAIMRDLHTHLREIDEGERF